MLRSSLIHLVILHGPTAESCTRISADNGEAAYIQRDESSNYDKYSNKKCSESNMGTYDDDDCEDRCDDESDCGAFVIVSSSYCKLYSTDGNHTRPIMPQIMPP